MPKVKHIALFQFTSTTTPDQIQACFDALGGMVGQIDGLLDFKYGPYDSDEGLNDGYTHAFIMTFDSPAARDAYLPHPIHEEVKTFAGQYLERFVVFDFNV